MVSGIKVRLKNISSINIYCAGRCHLPGESWVVKWNYNLNDALMSGKFYGRILVESIDE
jgi:hypothetical protein